MIIKFIKYLLGLFKKNRNTFSKNTLHIDSKFLVEYYYQVLVESSLQGLKFPVKEGKIEKDKLSKINLFFVNHNEEDKKQYIDNVKYIKNHIDSIKEEDREKYKIAYLPFAFKFKETSSNNREDKYITTPIYFTFNVDLESKQVIDDLVSISLNQDLEDDIFKNAQIVFNNLFASKSISCIDSQNLELLKSRLNDEDFMRKYSHKNFDYFKSFLLDYLDNSKSEIRKSIKTQDTYKLIVEKFYNALDKNWSFDNILDLEFKSAIVLMDSQELLESDLMYKGLINSYKNSIIPSIKNNDDPNYKLNRVFYTHQNKLVNKNEAVIQSNKKNSLDLNIQKVLELQKKHLGSFNSKFALTVSQRLSFCASSSNMNIIPVNGPPGTGKTALLRTIFSNYIVEKAFDAYTSYQSIKNSPLEFINTGKPILGTSSVKQAINNIIAGISEGFEEASTQGLKYTRWLDLPNYLENKVDLINKFVIVPQVRNSEEKYEKDILYTGLDAIFNFTRNLKGQELEMSYLENFNKEYKTKYKNLDDCVSLLYSEVSNLKENIIKTISSLNIDTNKEELFKVFESLDKTDRFELFFTSIHLLEAFFILNIKKINKKNDEDFNKKGCCPLCEAELEIDEKIRCKECNFELVKDEVFFNLKAEVSLADLDLLVKDSLLIDQKVYGIKYNPNSKKYNTIEIDKNNNIDHLSLIGPLFPMLTVTMHSLYGAFKSENTIVENCFDLVLTDESGMILSPYALPAIYVAKKIVVVGDEKQIEPIYPFDKLIDKNIFEKIKSKMDYSQFFENYSVLNQNFIKLVNQSSYFTSFEMQNYEENNLWLKEHFRCKDEIIEYCNKIVYKGILKPKVRTFSDNLYLDNEKNKYPSIRIFNLESEVTRNSSELEAQAITDYLFHNIKELCQIFNQWKKETSKPEEFEELLVENFHKKIGIVTPFNNQKALIEKTLSKDFNLDKILIGTVHAFQGSEKEIIIFSPAIDKGCTYTHFTNIDNGNMMNVAVSRAKNAFWVFGSVQGMKNAGEYSKAFDEYIEIKDDFVFTDKTKSISNVMLESEEVKKLKCPLCSEKLDVKEKVYRCSTQIYKDGKQSGCKFIIFKSNTKIGRELTLSEIARLINKEVIDEEAFSISLDISKKYFLDVKLKKDTNTRFVRGSKSIPKAFGGENFSDKEVEKLLNGESIQVKRISKYNKPYEVRLTLKSDNKSFNTKFI